MTEDEIKNVCSLMMHKNLSGHGTLFLNNPDGVAAVNAIHELCAKRDARQSTFDEMLAALQPFAKYSKYLTENYADHMDDIVVAGPLESNMTFGDFHRAYSAIVRAEKVKGKTND